MGITVSTNNLSLCGRRKQRVIHHRYSKEKTPTPSYTSTKSDFPDGASIRKRSDKNVSRRKSFSLTDLPSSVENSKRDASIISDLTRNNNRAQAVSSCLSVNLSRKTSKTNNTFGYGLVGLRNLGNTCFMNSILQCLCKTKHLRQYFWGKSYEKEINEAAETKGKIARAFGKLIQEIWSVRDDDYITPNWLKAEVQKFARRFSGYRQHDAQEFLLFLIEGIHNDLNLVKVKPKYKEIDDSSMSDFEKSVSSWERYLSREKSTIQDLFVGQLKCILTCTFCQYNSVTYDPFWDISLPIPAKRTIISDINLSDCLFEFTKEEILEGDERPTCERCTTKRTCKKRFLIEYFPKILVLHLKRFSEESNYYSIVHFPFELKLDQFAADSGGNKEIPTYSLYGVSNHTGGANSYYSGHYTAYCKHPDTGNWHLYNDAVVSRLAENRVVTSSAYVLFYEMISDNNS